MPIELKHQDLDILGWAVDKPNKNLAGGVYVDIDGKLFECNYGNITRHDVGAFFKDSVYIKSGYKATIPMNQIDTGLHTLKLKILTADKKSYYAPKRSVKFILK